MLTVTTPASDPTLLTLAEITAAVGASASDTDRLTQLNKRVSEMLAGACGLARAGVATLTLREETLSETLRLTCPADVIWLSRQPVTAVLSLTEDGEELAEDYDYEQDGPRKFLRVQNDCPSWWASGKIVVSYKAGWATVPNDLKELASKLAVSIWSEQGRDPNLKRRKIDGVSEREWWVGSKDDPLITAEIFEGLRSGGYLMRDMVY